MRRNVWNPVWLTRRAVLATAERFRSDEPWLSHACVRWLDRSVHGGTGFEWGSGRSTRWLGSRLDALTSVEHDLRWFETVNADLPPNVELRYIELDHPAHEPTRRSYEPVPAYVRAIDGVADGALDLVLVDGHYRQACIQRALPKLRPGGLLVVDNVDWLPVAEWGVPFDWPLVHSSANVVTRTSVWKRPNLDDGADRG